MDTLQQIYDNLDNIRIDLRKLGQKRPERPEYVRKKYFHAVQLFTKYEIIYNTFSKEQLLQNHVTSEKIKELFEIITTYVDSDLLLTVNMAQTIMFDIKGATSVIPILTKPVQNEVENLINCIELYFECIDKTLEKNLISFILKTRLNKTTRVTLNDKYDTIGELIDDIKKYLLPKKNSNTIQVKINSLKQDNYSITQYGNKLEELFAELTISQANNDSQTINVLKPINDKMAISTFANGLKDRHLSTIISARNPSHLREAIQIAQDHEVAAYQPGQQSLQLRGKMGARGHGSTPAPYRPQRYGNNNFRNQFTPSNMYNNYRYQGYRPPQQGYRPPQLPYRPPNQGYRQRPVFQQRYTSTQNFPSKKPFLQQGPSNGKQSK